MAGRLQERPDHHRQDKTSKGKMTMAGIHQAARTESWPRQLMAKWLNFKHTRQEFHHDCEINGAIGLEGKQEDCKQTYRRDIKDSRYKNLASVSGMSMALIHMQAAHCVLFVCFQGCS
jgi:hypothetical protein